MDTPDKNQPKKHFFKIPANYFELSEEEQRAFHEYIAAILDADDEETEGEQSHWLPRVRGNDSALRYSSNN